MIRSWIKELSSVIAASLRRDSVGLGEVRFLVGDTQVGLDLSSGEITDGSNASSEIVGSEETLARIVQGKETLQAAFRQGHISLSGDPEPFLRLAMVLDRCSGLKECVH
jgi:hypothetical protein